MSYSEEITKTINVIERIQQVENHGDMVERIENHYRGVWKNKDNEEYDYKVNFLANVSYNRYGEVYKAYPTTVIFDTYKKNIYGNLTSCIFALPIEQFLKEYIERPNQCCCCGSKDNLHLDKDQYRCNSADCIPF